MTTKIFTVTQKANIVAGGRVNGVTGVVVAAADSTQAASVAKGAFPADAATLWNSADTDETATDTNFTNFVHLLEIQGAADAETGDREHIYQAAVGHDGNYAVETVAINDGGADYLANDILTVAAVDDGDVPATFKVLTVDGGGAILTLAVVDPGSFAADVSDTGIATTDNSVAGAGATVDLTALTDSFNALLASAAKAMRAFETFDANGDSTGFPFDGGSLSIVTPKLIVAPSGDNYGKYKLYAEVQGITADSLPSGSLLTGFIASYTDNNGSAATALNVNYTLPTFAPKPLLTFK